MYNTAQNVDEFMISFVFLQGPRNMLAFSQM